MHGANAVKSVLRTSPPSNIAVVFFLNQYFFSSTGHKYSNIETAVYVRNHIIFYSKIILCVAFTYSTQQQYHTYVDVKALK